MKPTRFAALTASASSLSSVAFIIAVALGPIAQAGNTWDGGGGSGFWNTTTNWNVDGLPATGTALTFAGNVQNSTSNNLVAVDPSFAGILFTNTGAASNTNAFTLAGSRITLGGNITTTANTAGSTITDLISLDMIFSGTRTITTNQLSASVQHNLSISGKITESAASGLTKAGSGTLTLSGDNSYTGATSITGKLNIQHINALGTTAGGTTATATGTLQLQGGLSFAAEALTMTANSGSVVSLQNVSGDNTWNGAITTTGAGNFARISSDSGLLTVVGDVSSSGTTVVLQGAGAITVSGKISGTSGLISGSANAGAGSIRTLSNAANDFTGTVGISAGNLIVNSIKNVGAGNVSALGAPTSAATGTIAIGSVAFSGTLTYGGAGDVSDRVINLAGTTGGATIDQSGASGELEFTSALTATGLGNKTLTLQGSTGGTGKMGGAIVDSTGFATSLTKAGSGTWVLSGDNTFSGATAVNTGALNIRHINALGGTTVGTTVANGAALRVQGGLSFAAEALTLTAGTATAGMLQNVSGDNTWTGAITSTGAGNFARIASDSGLLTLSNASAITSSGTTVVLQGNGAITVSGKITGTSGLLSSATGSGLRTLSNATNDYTGTTSINGGTLSFSSIKNVGGGASTLGAPTTGTNGTISIGGGTTTGTFTYTGTGDSSDRVINLSGTTGGATIDQSGASGDLKFTGDLTATGVGSKTLTLQGSTSGTGEIGGAIVDNSGVNKTSVTKTGSGTWTLSGSNSYTGNTTISQGTLALTGTGTINSSPTIIVGASTTFDVSGVTGGYSLASAQTISGTGTVAGAMSVSGTLSPGNSPGVMATGSQTWLNGGDYNWQVLDATGAAGTGFDQIAVSGTLNLSSLTAGQFGINLWSLESIGPDVTGNALNFNNLVTQSWTILTTTGGITDFEATDFLISITANNDAGGFSNALGGGAFSLGQTDNNLVLTFTAVPEPNVAALLGGLGVLGLLRRRRN